MSDRMDATVAGRYLGTASGWDELDSWAIVLYDFEPNDTYKSVFPKCEYLNVLYDDGLLEFCDSDDISDDGMVVKLSVDLAVALAPFAKSATNG